MEIKSLDDLRRLREENKGKTGLRHGEGVTAAQTEIRVGMGTCGIAAGARETLGVIAAELERLDVGGVKVIPVGCVGHCHMEPIVIVLEPEGQPCAYGNVTKDKAADIVSRHILGGTPLEELRIDLDFDRI